MSGNSESAFEGCAVFGKYHDLAIIGIDRHDHDGGPEFVLHLVAPVDAPVAVEAPTVGGGELLSILQGTTHFPEKLIPLCLGEEGTWVCEKVDDLSASHPPVAPTWPHVPTKGKRSCVCACGLYFCLYLCVAHPFTFIVLVCLCQLLDGQPRKQDKMATWASSIRIRVHPQYCHSHRIRVGI